VMRNGQTVTHHYWWRLVVSWSRGAGGVCLMLEAVEKNHQPWLLANANMFSAQGVFHPGPTAVTAASVALVHDFSHTGGHGFQAANHPEATLPIQSINQSTTPNGRQCRHLGVERGFALGVGCLVLQHQDLPQTIIL